MPLNQEIAISFQDTINFNYALDNRTEVPEIPATYALWCDIPFGRLVGQSQVLYIGSTTKLGGPSDRCRLWGYKYPSTDQERIIRRSVDILTSLGRKIELRWCNTPPQNLDVGAYEKELLEMALQDHLELPPFNRRV